jgi:hypothetical protein
VHPSTHWRGAAGSGCVLVAMLLAGCGTQTETSPSPGQSSHQHHSTPSSAPSSEPSSAPSQRPHQVDASRPPAAGKVPPDAKHPASGICESSRGDVVVVTASPDTPAPRCAKVVGSQRLRVVNNSDTFGSPGQTITVRFADFAPRELAIGATTTFERSFGSYLMLGDHFLHISLYGGSGAEIYLPGTR